MKTTEQNIQKTKAREECQHLHGYWINRGVNFRCYNCGFQLHVANIPKNAKRRIEIWKEKW